MGRIINLLAANGVHLALENKRQVLTLDSELEQMESEITALKAENLRLQAQVNPLQREVDKLREQIERTKKKTAATDEQALDEKAQALLLAIANKFHVSEGRGESIIKGTPAQAAYYLGILKTRGLIKYHSANYTVNGRYVATQEGLDYLHKAGKI